MTVTEPEPRAFRPHLAALRLGSAAVLGALAGAAAAPFLAWQAAVLAGWSVAAVAFLLLVWTALLHLDAGATRKHAVREDDSRFAADVTLLGASVASLVAVGLLLVQGAKSGGAEEAISTGLSALSVVVSWAVVHTIFALHYARLYYTANGGVDFHDNAEPTYHDFAYLAFTIGMTYQVSDTEVPSRTIRRAVLHHALLSFVFGTMIIAMTINIIAGLVK